MNEIQGYLDQQASQWMQASALEIQAIEKLSQYTDFVSRFFRDGGSGSWLLRGEARLYNKPASPSLLRSSEDSNQSLTRHRFPHRSITDKEVEEVEKCQRDRPNGSDRYINAFIPSMHALDVNWLPIARHFGYQTRLLDVTVNPLVALYFACDPEDSHDGYVYAMQTGGFRPVNNRNPPLASRNDYPHVPINYLDLYDVDVDHHSNNFDKLAYHFEAPIPQERLIAQAGSFLFWRDLDYVLPKNRQLIPIRVAGDAKERLRGELSAFSVTHRFLFPNQ